MEKNDTKGGNVESLESEICRILIEGFGLNNEVIAIEGGDCSHLDLNESTVIEKIEVNEKDEFLITPCPRCKDGWLKRPCIVCHGIGKINDVICTKCRGTGEYILRPTKHYEGKQCYSCKGSGLNTRKLTTL